MQKGTTSRSVQRNVTAVLARTELVFAAAMALLLVACADRGVPPSDSRAGEADSGYPLTQNESAAGVDATDIIAARYPPLDPRRYGANAEDGSANSDQTALQMAVDVAEVAGGSVPLSEGVWNGCVTLGAPGVSIVGQGSTATVLLATGCDAITLDFATGFGNTVIRDLDIEGARAARNTAIKAPGTDAETDELYGLTIDRVLVRRFNVGFHSRTLRNFAIMNSWFQDVDRAVELLGKNLVGRIAYSTFVHGAGAGGAGPKVGLTVGGHTYADGTFVPAEGLQVTFNQFYGFATGINLDFATVVNVIGNDFQAAVSGVEFTTVQQKLNITDNTFDMAGLDVAYAIVGHGLASEIDTKVAIERNGILGTRTRNAVGIQINDDRNTNQYHVDILGNFINGMTRYDIAYMNPGPGTIARNYAKSERVEKCIKIGPRQAGNIRVYDNDCVGEVEFEADDERAGHLRLQDNTVSGRGER